MNDILLEGQGQNLVFKENRFFIHNFIRSLFSILPTMSGKCVGGKFFSALDRSNIYGCSLSFSGIHEFLDIKFVSNAKVTCCFNS